MINEEIFNISIQEEVSPQTAVLSHLISKQNAIDVCFGQHAFVPTERFGSMSNFATRLVVVWVRSIWMVLIFDGRRVCEPESGTRESM